MESIERRLYFFFNNKCIACDASRVRLLDLGGGLVVLSSRHTQKDSFSERKSQINLDDVDEVASLCGQMIFVTVPLRCFIIRNVLCEINVCGTIFSF